MGQSFHRVLSSRKFLSFRLRLSRGLGISGSKSLRCLVWGERRQGEKRIVLHTTFPFLLPLPLCGGPFLSLLPFSRGGFLLPIIRSLNCSQVDRQTIELLTSPLPRNPKNKCHSERIKELGISPSIKRRTYSADFPCR